MFKSMFRDVKYYTEFIIDDFQVDNTGREHALGFKLGINRMKIFGLSWMLEFINIDKWTFLHHGNFTSWVNFGKPIGFPYGPDSKTIKFQSIYSWDDFSIYFNLERLIKGPNNLSTNWNNFIFDENIDKKPKISVQLCKFNQKNKSLTYELGISNRPIENELNGRLNLVKSNYRYF